MTTSLKDIRRPIITDLKDFQSYLRKSVKSDNALIDRVTMYLVKQKGKQLRPSMVLLFAKMLGQVNESTHIAASLVEMLHTASLIHDDVVDGADKRRGVFSINALWKNKIAVLVGDYLLSRGLLLALDNEKYKFLQIMSKAVKSLTEGELLQLEKARRLDINEEIYYEIIKNKTASLIAAACSLGAASVIDDASSIELARQYGEYLGMAYQIKDDLFDYGDTDIGKPVGIDLKEQKMTLPLIHALSKSSRADKRRIINAVKNNNSDQDRIDEVLSFVRSSGGIGYASNAMEAYKAKADNLLLEFPDNEARTSLIKLNTFVIERKK